jgi:hypothetical protein
MSTPADEPTLADDATRREILARLTDELDEALAGVEIARAEVGKARRREGRLIVPVAVEPEAASDARDGAGRREKSGSEEDPEGFEEALEYVLDKNRKLYQRLS